MGTSKMPRAIDHGRRHFFGTAALTVAAAQLRTIGSADAEADKARPPPVVRSGSNTSFVALKQINAGSRPHWEKNSCHTTSK